MIMRILTIAVFAALFCKAYAQPSYSSLEKPNSCTIEVSDTATIQSISDGATDLIHGSASPCLSPDLTVTDDDKPPTLAQWREALNAANRDIDTAREGFDCSSNANQPACGVLTGLTERVSMLRADLDRIEDGEPWRTYLSVVQPAFSSDYLYVGRINFSPERVDLCALFDTGGVEDADNNSGYCEQHASDPCSGSCRESVQTLETLLVHVAAMHEFARDGVRPALLQNIEEQAILAAQSRAYAIGDTAADTQWPWELVVNGWVHSVTLDNPDPGGYVRLIRPHLGLEFYEADGTEATLNGMVELLGYTWIDWQGAKRVDGVGVGLVLGYGMADETEEIGYGLQVRNLPQKFGYNGFGSDIDIAVLYREDDEQISVVFSRSLQGIFNQRRCAYLNTCEN